MWDQLVIIVKNDFERDLFAKSQQSAHWWLSK